MSGRADWGFARHEQLPLSARPLIPRPKSWEFCERRASRRMGVGVRRDPEGEQKLASLRPIGAISKTIREISTWDSARQPQAYLGGEFCRILHRHTNRPTNLRLVQLRHRCYYMGRIRQSRACFRKCKSRPRRYQAREQ